MDLGLALGGSLVDIAGLAAAAEEAGAESVWVAELEHSAVVQAAAAIAATRRIAVGTAAALAFPRSPTIVAMEAADLAELAGGRFLLGLGSQIPSILEARFGIAIDHPAPRMVDYVTAVRTVWAAARGADLRHEGPFYRIRQPTFHGPARPDLLFPPILVAAVGPRMARGAGAVADGVLGHPLASPDYLERVLAPAVADGARQAGRSPDTVPLTATIIVALDDGEPERARHEARRQIAFYATTPAYRGILALHGREALGPVLRRAFARRDDAALTAAIDDEFLDAVAVAGPTATVAERLGRWARGGLARRAILAPPWYRVEPGRFRALTEACLRLIGELGGRVVDPTQPAG